MLISSVGHYHLVKTESHLPYDCQHESEFGETKATRTERMRIYIFTGLFFRFCFKLRQFGFSYPRKIPKISLGAYIFQRPFLRGLFLEGLKFGGAYVRREIRVSKSIKLACSGKQICFVFTMYSRANSQYKPPGGLIFGRAI